MPQYYIDCESFTLPVDGAEVTLVGDVKVRRDDSPVPNSWSRGAGERVIFRASDPEIITVPTLVPGTISNVDPEIGDVLAVTGSNASASAAFNWQVGGVDLDPAVTTAGLNTTGLAAGNYRRGVSDGGQGPFYTPAVAVTAPATGPLLLDPFTVDTIANFTNTTDFTIDTSGGGRMYRNAPTPLRVQSVLSPPALGPQHYIAVTLGELNGTVRLYALRDALGGSGNGVYANWQINGNVSINRTSNGETLVSGFDTGVALAPGDVLRLDIDLNTNTLDVLRNGTVVDASLAGFDFSPYAADIRGIGFSLAGLNTGITALEAGNL